MFMVVRIDRVQRPRANSARVLTGVLVLSALGSGCEGVAETQDEQASGTAALGGDDVVYLDQGWDEATRDAFYQTSQGSRMLPYDWFLNLEQASNASLFRAATNMRAMGYLVEEETSALNPDGLPVGFARDVDPVRGDAVGFTCAACHTGQIEFLGTSIRIDGGQSFGDVEKLQNGLLASLNATLANSTKFDRFAKKVIGPSVTAAQKADLRTKVQAKADWWTARIARSKGASPHGPTRTDAFTIIGNEVVCDLFKDPRNCATPNAPTQFPHLWDTSDLEWVQYNSSVHSPIGRNVGQATGVFAESSIDTTSPLAQAGLIVDSTARLSALHALEGAVKTLHSPKWPEAILGPINQTLASQGEALYDANCASCHNPDPARTGPNAFGKTFARVDFSTPLFPGPNGEIPAQGLLGTDSTAALSFATRRAFPGPFTLAAQANGLIGPDGKASVAALLGISGSMIIQRFFAINAFTDVQKLTFLDFRESRTPTTQQLTTYKARPLNGAVFSAPYLHNGSVSSLYELLLPPAQRKKTFYVGSKQFDPVKVGFSTLPALTNSMLYDTTLVGNGNGGHVWGTTLTVAQRMAVIEYMKTL